VRAVKETRELRDSSGLGLAHVFRRQGRHRQTSSRGRGGIGACCVGDKCLRAQTPSWTVSD
jgi:hypothetical protein